MAAKPMREWVDKAACAQTHGDSFHEQGSPGKSLRAVCARCPVQVECRDYAVENQLRGFWGGTSSHQRKADRRVQS